MLGPQNALKTWMQPSLWFQSVPADAGEVGLTPAYFYTVAVGYYSS